MKALSLERGEMFQHSRFSWIQLFAKVSENAAGLAVSPPQNTLTEEDEIIALRRFDETCGGLHASMLAAASGRVARDGLGDGAWVRHPEACFRHAVRCHAIAWTEQRFTVTEGLPARLPDEQETLMHLHEARHNLRNLTRLERQVFRAMSALDSIAAKHETTKIVLAAAVAFGMRPGTAHQHMSRVRRKLFPTVGSDFWKYAWKYLYAPPPALGSAARNYLDVCQAREAGLERWVEAHKTHNACFNVSKKRSQRAAEAWRDFVTVLDIAPPRPFEIQARLIAQSRDLGIDTEVIPSRLAGSSWGKLLFRVKRPSRSVRPAWTAFLSESGFDPKVLSMWQAFETQATLAETARSKLNEAFEALLDAAGSRPNDFLNARNEFRRLVDAP